MLEEGEHMLKERACIKEGAYNQRGGNYSQREDWRLQRRILYYKRGLVFKEGELILIEKVYVQRGGFLFKRGQFQEEIFNMGCMFEEGAHLELVESLLVNAGYLLIQQRRLYQKKEFELLG